MMNFEDEDFDLAEGFLDEVLPPSRVPPRSAGGSVSGGGGGGRRTGWSLPAAPAAAGRPDRPDDPGGFSCTPDSVSVSQMFGLRAGYAGALPARPAPGGPIAPASPDPFADDLMDADLLDACEAAEATPAAADLPTVSAERPGSRDMLNGIDAALRDMRNGMDAASRDMRNGIGAGSRDALDGSAAVETPSRDTSASGRIPDLGSRDAPVAGAFPGSGSRDTPTNVRRPGDGSRVSGRRSTGSAVKRRFPGPAGILPITGSLLTLAHEVSLQEDDLTATGEDDDPSLHDTVSESQLSQPEEAAAWESGPWRQMLAELRLSPADPNCLLRRINMAAIRRAAAANQLRKVPLLAALLQTLEPTSDLSYQATFRDPTGQMDGTVAKDAFETCGAALRPGCVLVLRDVVVWRESARRLYLSVTRRSLVYLFPETPSGADAVSVVQLSELSALELASARLVEKPPSVAVLQESPPPSPPRPQLYPTPQQASGGGGGRGQRGRGGRSWRGRGAGGSSGGRPSPYTPQRGGGGAGGSSGGRPSPYTPHRGGRGAGGSSGGRPSPYTPQRGGGGGGGSPANRTPAAASPAMFGAATASPALRTAPAAARAAATPRSADSRPTASSPLVSGPGDGPRAARAASPALRPYPRPAAAPAPAAARQNHPAAAVRSATAAPRPPPPAATKHKPDTISAAEIDAMFDDDDDVLFGQL